MIRLTLQWLGRIPGLVLVLLSCRSKMEIGAIALQGQQEVTCAWQETEKLFSSFIILTLSTISGLLVWAAPALSPGSSLILARRAAWGPGDLRRLLLPTGLQKRPVLGIAPGLAFLRTGEGTIWACQARKAVPQMPTPRSNHC